MKYLTIVNGQRFEIEVGADGRLLVNGARRSVDFHSLGPSLYSIIAENLSLQAAIDGDGGDYEVLLNGQLYEARVLDERALLMMQRRGGAGAASGELRAPMPGLIVQVPVAPGQEVERGEVVIILESMKMQNELLAPAGGEIESLHCEAGETVEKDALLVVIRPGDE